MAAGETEKAYKLSSRSPKSSRVARCADVPPPPPRSRHRSSRNFHGFPGASVMNMGCRSAGGARGAGAPQLPARKFAAGY
ncbi:hypothetical protein EVAR_7691_1 [Eumeta japonica]|uniref:Uncharacterized protein n=1 Tax=Eumeta variegata TaxID=151549 RepID=A0A4C1TKY4_EUMVA|nr:hypothetical protein EVAR_7691_1 [Eumeta japonica]